MPVRALLSDFAVKSFTKPSVTLTLKLAMESFSSTSVDPILTEVYVIKEAGNEQQDDDGDEPHGGFRHLGSHRFHGNGVFSYTRWGGPPKGAKE